MQPKAVHGPGNEAIYNQYLKVTADNDAVNYNANNYSQSGSTR